MGMETLTIKGDLLETNFQCFYQKGLHWRPQLTSLYMAWTQQLDVPFCENQWETEDPMSILDVKSTRIAIVISGLF